MPVNPPRFFRSSAAPFRPSVRARRGAFALVVTLLILSLLVIVAVSYLSSAASERQTADAFDSKAVAEQAAQAGVDSATAMLAECFRDFPDSATVWDTQQSTTTGTPSNGAIVSNPSTNEGTSLYLRAVPTGTSPVVANPLPHGTLTAAGGAPYPANDPAGNNPNNPACETFVLPLISGVPNGQARLVTEKGSIFPAMMNIAEPDPAKQNWTDLNVRRMGGDLQGAIGSPPNWSNVGPKPARAYWVNLKGNDGLLKGRYAFWIDDESFRANVNYAYNATARKDNGPDASTKRYPLDAATNQPYILHPSDGSLIGILATAFDANNVADAQSILNTRTIYPGSFLPEPLAFVHDASGTTGATSFTPPVVDALRYLTTTQGSTLNLSRHGTQRLNLNTTISTPDLTQAATATAAIQRQVSQLFQTIQFHLPNFGQRFYRTTSATDASSLNATQVVYTSTLKSESIGDPNIIYPYKVAANLRDYIDTDSQPTLIQAGGTVQPVGLPNPLQPFGDDGQPNPMWAVGKEAAPVLQETAVRFRPVAPQSGAGKGTYTLAVDYYLEFWNMTDHDIYASPQTDATLAHLNSAQIRVSDQQTWISYGSGAAAPLTVSDPTKPAPQEKVSDFTIDLTGGGALGNVYLNGVVQDGSGNTSNGVVFRAGMATVITTDPDYQTYNFSTPTTTGHSPPIYTSKSGLSNPKTTFYCPIVPPGSRTFAGPLNQGTSTTQYGLQPTFRDGTQDYGTEITFFNQYGYLDCALFSVAEGGTSVTTFTDSSTGSGGYNDYSYGGSLYGNSVYSEMGDPRTNNEQMIFHRNSIAGSGDYSRYYNGNHTLGYPDENYVQPVGGALTPPGGSSTTFIPWPDYYTWPDTGFTNPTPATAPAVIADRPLAAVGQLGDVFDPARVTTYGTPETARGGGRTFKIGQRDDRVTYDSTGSSAGNATLNNIPASMGWASWRLADIFSAGPVLSSNPYGPTQEPLEMPGRININGVARDNGAALRVLLTGFNFQPATVDASLSASSISEPLFHTPPALAGLALLTQPTDSSGVTKLVNQITTRLNTQPSTSNVPWGPFFERGELGELQIGNTAIFGTNAANTFQVSKDLTGSVDLNHTFDRGREELCRRLMELICTRGDTFTVYAVGQSLIQNNAAATPKIAGTQRMRVTFRLVPKSFTSSDGFFHPAYQTNMDGTIKAGVDFTPTSTTEVTNRFAKPDRYDVQILEVNVF